MKNILKNIVLAAAFVLFVAAPVMTVATPQTAQAADCEVSLIGIPPWYRGLTEEVNGECNIVSPNDVGGISNFIWLIALNVIQIGLVIIGWVALFFILYGGFLFITGGGNSAQVEKARKSIFNAVIGLVISLGAIAITNLIFGVLDGATPNPEFGGVPQISGDDLLRAGVNLVYYVAGIAAVIVIIIAGLMYTTSMGDSARISRSKNMIIYAVVGLIVLLVAFALTNFIMDRF